LFFKRTLRDILGVLDHDAARGERCSSTGPLMLTAVVVVVVVVVVADCCYTGRGMHKYDGASDVKT
jgi:hypothetical protein